jgi:hypothetical protein
MARLTDAPLDPPFDDSQNTAEDQLTPGDIDPLDTGYDPPEHEPLEAKRLWDGDDESPMDEELDAETPEVWDETEEEVDTRRAGRIVSLDSDDVQDIFAQDDGLDGMADSAEEAAVHYQD